MRRAGKVPGFGRLREGKASYLNRIVMGYKGPPIGILPGQL